MPTFDQMNLNNTLQFFAAIGTIVAGTIAIVYSFLFVGERALQTGKARGRLLTGIIAASVVVILAILDIYLTVVSI
jgi:hypothetical protein